MLKMLNAITGEIDDPAAAAAEILEQIGPGRNLLDNSVGLAACSYEFIEPGTLERLAEALPFDIAGITTLGNAARGRYGMDFLSLTVLTADDVRFSSAVTGKIRADNLEQEMAGAFERAGKALGSKPGFILAYPPMMSSLGGSAFFNGLRDLAGDTPVFGGCCCDQTLKFQESRVLYNGKDYRESLAFVLMAGNIRPRFFVTAMPDKNVQKQHAVITESEGVILKKVNNMTLLDYLGSLGLTRDGGIDAIATIPFMVDCHDGAKPAALGIYEITKEGYARCGGNVPVDATLAIGVLDYETVMETAEAAVSRILGGKDINGVLMYPCLTRNMLLGLNGTDEMKKITGLLGDLPYQLVYAAGEICPLENAEGRLVNHFHNFTFTACVL
jgi:hypothetical protein